MIMPIRSANWGGIVRYGGIDAWADGAALHVHSDRRETYRIDLLQCGHHLSALLRGSWFRHLCVNDIWPVIFHALDFKGRR